MITYESIILLCWAAFLLVWSFSAFNVKKDMRGGGFARAWSRLWLLRIVAAALIIFVAFRIGTGTAHFSGQAFFSNGKIFMPPLFLGWIAAVLAVIGLGVAIWARVYLGRNWSAAPAVKKDHELVTTGPYAYIRHPIYSGVGLMVFGTALAGNFFGLFMLIFMIAIFGLRIGKEEKIMLELFPNEYPEYQKKTKRLIPYIW